MPLPCCPTCKRDLADLSGIKVDIIGNTIATRQGVISLTDRQAELLAVLLKFMPGFVTRERICTFVYGAQDGGAPQNVDVFVCQLRKRLGSIGLRIETKWGVGYRLMAEDT